MAFEFDYIKTDIVLCDNAFTEEELDEIKKLTQEYLHTIGRVSTETGDEVTRKHLLVRVPHAIQTRILYKRMAEVAKEINEKYFKFDILSYVGEGVLALEYNQPGDHLDWHIDNAKDYRKGDPVKLIVVLQLSDPTEYEGCDIEVASWGMATIPKKKGLIYAMPGYTSHRVTKLISGHRVVASAWFTGPNFK